MKKYLITLLGRYGDLILATPIFDVIKSYDRNSKVSVIAGRKNYEILLNNPNVDEILVYDKNPLKLIPFLIKLKFQKFDYYIDVKDHFSNESKILANLVNANVKIGYNKANKAKVFDIDFTLDKKDCITHFTSISLHSISKIGIDISNYNQRPTLFQSLNSQEYVQSFLNDNNISNFTLINISATSKDRIWDINNWNELINSTILKSKKLIITFAPEEKFLASKFCELNNHIILFNSRNFSDVISLCANADEILSPDTSIVHIASAFDKPLLALYSGIVWNYKKFYPTSSKYVVVQSPKDIESIKDISITEVINAYNKLIEL